MTLDGKIATASGHSAWVTSPDARANVFKMRANSDVVIVGGNTVRLLYLSVVCVCDRGWQHGETREWICAHFHAPNELFSHTRAFSHSIAQYAGEAGELSNESMEVRRDNPRLTTRQEGGHAPVRVVMSRTLELPEVCAM
eukprot:1159815-Pelagomonas_calceolata.AAC.10